MSIDRRYFLDPECFFISNLEGHIVAATIIYDRVPSTISIKSTMMSMWAMGVESKAPAFFRQPSHGQDMFSGVSRLGILDVA